MIGEQIKEASVSVLVHWPDDPDEGRGAVVAHDVRDGETVTELLTRLLDHMIKNYPATVPHVKMELRVKDGWQEEEENFSQLDYPGRDVRCKVCGCNGVPRTDTLLQAELVARNPSMWKTATVLIRCDDCRAETVLCCGVEAAWERWTEANKETT